MAGTNAGRDLIPEHTAVVSPCRAHRHVKLHRVTYLFDSLPVLSGVWIMLGPNFTVSSSLVFFFFMIIAYIGVVLQLQPFHGLWTQLGFRSSGLQIRRSLEAYIGVSHSDIEMTV